MLVVVRHAKLVCDGSFLSRGGMMMFVMSSLLFVSDCMVGCSRGDVVDVVWCMNGVVIWCVLRLSEENLQCRHKKLCDVSILLQCLELTLWETLRLGMKMCVEK